MNFQKSNESFLKPRLKRSNLLDDLLKKDINGSLNPYFKSKYKFSSQLVKNLNLDSELHGHDGCVNCLEWNQSGTMLASGSDDLNVMIWTPFKYRQDGQDEQNTRRLLSHCIPTKHRGNIFGVKFLPHTQDTLIASCAADRDIYIYDINDASRPLSSARTQGDLPLPIHSIHSHSNRVKRLETSQSEPFLFWSCGEDGLVIEHDIRASSSERSRVLLAFSKSTASLGKLPKESSTNKKEHLISNLETKCLAINQVRSEYLAVGCNDPVARIYDRRALRFRRVPERSSNSSIESCLFEYSLNESESSQIPVSFFAPGHLPFKVEEYRKRMKTLSVTFIAFNSLGNELLVNLGGEQLYLYDFVTYDGQSSSRMFKFDSYAEIFKKENLTDEDQKTKIDLTPKADLLKQKANSCFESKNYVEAIEFYNQAIEIVPNSAILFGNRAAALMKRGWEGDTYAAMRDCYQALQIDNKHLKSHFRLAKCLNDLGWYIDARNCLMIFSERFPDYARTSACENLQRDINENITKSKATTNRGKKSQNSNKRFKRSYMRAHNQGFSSRGNDEDDSEESDSDSESNKNNFEQSLASENTSSESYQPTTGQSMITNLLIQKYREAHINTIDFKKRYCGHCNVATDIKEANFIGEDFIAAGSDDGCIFLWEKNSTNIIRVLKGDDSIVNCIQPHPSSCYLATSGIDPLVRIWSPKIPDAEELKNKRRKKLDTKATNSNDSSSHELDDETESDEDSRVVHDIRSAEINNHMQMNSHPFEFLFLNLAPNWESDEDFPGDNQRIRCSQS